VTLIDEENAAIVEIRVILELPWLCLSLSSHFIVDHMPCSGQWS